MLDKALISKRMKMAAAAFVASLVLAFCAATPAKALADEVMAYSLDDTGYRTNYYTTDAALTAGYAGKTIYLDCDWHFTGTLQIADSQTIIIDMNGHKITTDGKATVVLLNENANLTLKSSKQVDFTYKGYSGTDGSEQNDLKINTGGLVVNGVSTDEAGGIRMNNNSTLTLDNVAVAGCSGSTVGGVYMKKSCTLNLNNNASVNNNKGETGGVYINQAKSTINMDHSSIYRNYGSDKGGGVSSNDDYTKIVMNNLSSIYENTGYEGGGIALYYAYFTVTSTDDDKTSTVKDNMAKRAGGIMVDDKMAAQNEGIIENITISGNQATREGLNGGGIGIYQNYTRVTNCDILNNSAACCGGGVYVGADNCSITNCTITGNKAATKSSDGIGGGVFVSSKYDAYLSGVCTIRDNTHGDNVKDNVALQSQFVYFSTHQAHILGGVEEGSSVGVYTTCELGSKIGKKIDNFTYGTYFSDVDGRCITPGTKTPGSDGTLWISAGTNGYLAKVNGVGSTRYQKGATVTADGSSTESGKHFWRWSLDTSQTTGLSPINEYINSDNMYDQVLSYAMPDNDTNLQAEYVEYVQSGVLSITKPKAGESLVCTGSFVRTDGYGEAATIPATVTWYTVDADGNETPASGVAEPGKSYKAVVKIAASKEFGQFFEDDILTKDKVTVRTDSTGEGDKLACSTKSNAADQSIEIETFTYDTEDPAIASVEEATISVQVGAEASDVVALFPASANVVDNFGNKHVVATDVSKYVWPDGMFVGGKVVMPEGDDPSYTVTIGLADVVGLTNPDKKNLSLKVQVTDVETPAQPQVTPIASTYSSATTPALDANLQLKVQATCETTGATIMYKVNGGSETAYNSSTGIVLQGEANKSTQVKLEVWSQVAGATAQSVKKSPVLSGIYTLDDTLNKEITVKCADTALYAAGEAHWAPTFTVKGDLGTSVAIVAPEQGGRVFDHWDWAGAPAGTDLASATLIIPSYSLEYTNQITAVYTPVISTIDLEADAPVAHDALDTTAKSVKVGVGAGEATTDISQYLASTALAWTPSDRIGSNGAAHMTTYAAIMSLAAGSAVDGVKYLLADNVKLLVNGNDVHGGAYIIGNPDGTKSIEVDFPETGPYEYAKLSDVTDGKLNNDIELTYAEALAYQNTQDEGGSASWDLPSATKVEFKCGEYKYVDVSWTVTGFSKDATGEQELSATGTVNYTSDIDNSGAPKTITATIKVAAPETVATPASSVEQGTYTEPQSVTLSCATEAATIYYTLDGTDPTQASEKFVGEAIYIAENTTLKACAYKDGMKASAVATYDYKIDYQQVDVPTATPGTGLYATTQQVALATETQGATIFYTTDGTEPDLSSQRYDGTPITVSDTTTIKAMAGKEGMVESETSCFTYVIERERVAKPTASVDSGTYEAPQSVVFSCSAEDAVIHYTTDGSDPDETSPVYDADYPLEVGSTMTVRVRAYSTNPEVLPSDVAEFNYTIAEPEFYTVTFDSNGGSSIEPASVSVKEGACVAKPADPTRDSYSFAGWALSGEAYDFSTPVTDNITLEAQWIKNPDPEPDPDPQPQPEPTPSPVPSGDGDGGSTDGGVTPGGSGSSNGNASTQAGLAATGDATPFALVGFAALVACAAFALAALKLRRNR